MAQIIPIVSDALQATIRRLLPSQNGFGEDLQAQNVIVPIIDLTPTAEGSNLPGYLQTARGFDQTKVQAQGSTVTVTSTAGFYQLDLFINSGTGSGVLEMSDGFSVKEITLVTGTDVPVRGYYVFVPVGYTLQVRSNSATTPFTCDFRQIADVNGVLSEPFGYTPQ